MEGAVFGPYLLRRLLGEGGMGQVYEAYDTGTERTVALKVLPHRLGDDALYRSRFRREANIVARLNDPHVVPIHTFGEIDGRLYLDMRLVAGGSLQTLLSREGALAPQKCVAIVDQVAAALDDAHAHGIIHRDVKPSNILVGARDFVYLIDFGIAHSTGDTKLTTTGKAIGTIAYMAPERFSGGPVDARADVYALACILYECLTGRGPFSQGSIEQQIAAHLSSVPVPPSRIHAVPHGFDEVLARGLAKVPGQRYATAGELAAAAHAALASPEIPRAVSEQREQEINSAPKTFVDPAINSAPQTVVDPIPETVVGPIPETVIASPALGRKHTIKPAIRVALVLLAVVVVVLGVVWRWPRTSYSDSPSPSPNLFVRVLTTIDGVGQYPSRVANTVSGIVLYVASGSNDNDCTISRIDHATHSVKDSFQTGNRFPTHLFTDINDLVVLDGSKLTVLDPFQHTVIADLPFAATVAAFDPNSRLLVTDDPDGIRLFDLASRTVTGTVGIRGIIRGIAIDELDHTVLVLTSSQLHWIDPTTWAVTASLDIDDGSELAVDSFRHTPYVLLPGGALVAVDPVKKTIAARIDPQPGTEITSGTTILADPQLIFVNMKHGDHSTISIIDPEQHNRLAEIDVPSGSRHMALNGGSLYVVRDGGVTVLELTR